MAYLVKPDLDEMYYRAKLYASSNTMNGNTEAFPKEEWESFYRQNVECDPKDRFYRYQYCPDCADFTGELGWVHNKAKKRYELFIRIQYERRNDGYGKDGIENLLKAARKNGITKLYAVVSKDNKAAGFFEHIGMHKEPDEGNSFVFSKATEA